MLPVAVAVLHSLPIGRHYQFLAVGNWKDPSCSMSDLSLVNSQGPTSWIVNKVGFGLIN